MPDTAQDMSSALPIQYSDSLADFCRFAQQCTESPQEPHETVELCELHAETVRIRPHDVTSDSIDLLFETLLQVITNLESQRLQERQQRRWIFQFKKRLRAKPARSRKSGPNRIAQEKKRKRRSPRKIVVLQLSECESLPPADLLLLEPGKSLQDFDLDS